VINQSPVRPCTSVCVWRVRVCVCVRKSDCLESVGSIPFLHACPHAADSLMRKHFWSTSVARPCAASTARVCVCVCVLGRWDAVLASRLAVQLIWSVGHLASHGVRVCRFAGRWYDATKWSSRTQGICDVVCSKYLILLLGQRSCYLCALPV